MIRRAVTALAILSSCMRLCVGRPTMRSSIPHGYYGHYNKCKLQIVPWPENVSCDENSLSSLKLSQNFSVVLSVESASQESKVLKSAIQRYYELITGRHPVRISRGLLVEPQFIFEGDDDDYSYAFSEIRMSDSSVRKLFILDELVVTVFTDHTSDSAKKLDDDESYSISIYLTDDSKINANVKANSVWGALYALETFSQLVENGNVIRHIPVEISDQPRYPWRGLLIDTSNHYLSVPVIKKLLDAMATTKMNVLHWHLVDSYSFPYHSKLFPGIAEAGAWMYNEDTNEELKSTVYKSSDLEEIVNWAALRGVRVVLEMDMPGHAYSWGLADKFKDITTSCPAYTDELGHIDDVPLDPTLVKTYDVIEDLLLELTAIFPDQYLHVGGDEVKYGCWNESESILSWMSEHGFADGDFYGLEQMFFDRIHTIATAEMHRKLVAWEEVFFNASGGSDGSHGAWIGSEALPPSTTVVESWTGPSYLNTARLNGYDAILAYGWYLDRQSPVDGQNSWFFGDTWAQMYSVDPESPQSRDPKMQLLLEEQRLTLEENARIGLPIGRALGGEASIWTEQADDQNIESQVWPRAAAVAERLWSQQSITDPAAAAPRLSSLRCLLVARFGIKAGPIWSDYCSAALD